MDAGLVQLLDDGFGRDADGADKELRARVDDDVDELVELALGVVVAGGRVSGARMSGKDGQRLTWSYAHFHRLGEAADRYRRARSGR
jgi:hypothetical protein